MLSNPSVFKRLALNVLAIGAGALIGACSSTQQPAKSQLSVSKSAVDNASMEAGADAPIEIAAAQTKLERARKAFNERDYVAARQLGEQAQADAQLAEAQSRSERADRALTNVKDGIRQLRDEMNRTQQPSPVGQQ